MSSVEQAIRYHDQTKHHFHRHAKSLGYLDWATQPDPFRRFDGAPVTRLALGCEDTTIAYDSLYRPGSIPPRPVCFESVSALMELALGLSAWKQLGGARWALRMNPSSGNLHPTEGYVVIGPTAGLHDGPAVYHYAPNEHALERRATPPPETWARLLERFPDDSFLVGLSSIHWREAWKYGERAYRYCQHDVGHALAAVSLSAALQGWRAVCLDGVSDAELAALLGLDRDEDFDGAEREHPDLLVAVVPSLGRTGSRSFRSGASRAHTRWTGRANRLSRARVDWPLIDATAGACERQTSECIATDSSWPSFDGEVSADRPDVSASNIIRTRRSAVAMDGRTSITAEQLYLMLDRTLPRADRAPWAALGAPACVHLGLFVHRVEGLAPGLYCLLRSPGARSKLQQAMKSTFSWETPASCPSHLAFHRLAGGDYRAEATALCCHQPIAGESAFSLGMIAEFEPRLGLFGAWYYRRLFWETGVVGQVLYLEAEAAGVRATGIGCFYDDAVHALFGLSGTAYQSLYHFTVGGPVEDPRLSTLPPYPAR